MLSLVISAIMANPLFKRGFSGQATYYGINQADPAPLGIGACENMPSDTNYFVAVGAGAYDKSRCGECVQVFYQDKSTIGPVADLCPSCGTGLDLSLQMFSELASPDVGRIDITWEFVPCPPGRGVNGGPVSSNTNFFGSNPNPPVSDPPVSDPPVSDPPVSDPPVSSPTAPEALPTSNLVDPFFIVPTEETSTTFGDGSYPTTLPTQGVIILASGATGLIPFLSMLFVLIL